MRTKISVPIAAIACLGIATLLVAPKIAHAQAAPVTPAAGGRRGGRRAANPVANAFKAVTPTADEQTKFDALTATYTSDMTAARAEADQAEMRKKTAAALMTYRSAAEALLTPDQLTKFKQAYFASPIMRSLNTQLMLTDDEKTKVEPILNDYASKAEGLKGAEMRSLADDTKAKIRAVLTADQQTKLDAMRGLNAGGGGRRGGAGAPPAPTAPPAANPPATPPTL